MEVEDEGPSSRGGCFLRPPTSSYRCHENICSAILRSRLSGRRKSVEAWAEERCTWHNSCEPVLESPARSTISIDFSPNGDVFASTHGDHSVRIVSFLSGKIIRTLIGHRRTPWTVKFNPADTDIVASGDLDFEIRVWSISSGLCTHSANLEFAIISLSFHPSGGCLAAASGTQVFFWDYNRQVQPVCGWIHNHTIRCVCFAPTDPSCLYVGAANGHRTPDADSTFSILAWEFSLPKLSMTHPQVLVRRAILYNDGGFGISSCGRYICALAEYWRPRGSKYAQLPGYQREQHQQHKGLRSRKRERPGWADSIDEKRYWEYEKYWEMLCDVAREYEGDAHKGDYVPFVVKLSLTLNYDDCALPWVPGEAKVISARSFESYYSHEITCVKFSPNSEFIVVGCSVMDFLASRYNNSADLSIPQRCHPISSIYSSRDMSFVSAVESHEDTNSVLFHPQAGQGVVYGTKQGQVYVCRSTGSDISLDEEGATN